MVGNSLRISRDSAVADQFPDLGVDLQVVYVIPCSSSQISKMIVEEGGPFERYFVIAARKSVVLENCLWNTAPR
jgi:hypothetical protein